MEQKLQIMTAALLDRPDPYADAARHLVALCDRREQAAEAPYVLESLFNILNHNKGDAVYPYQTLHAGMDLPRPEKGASGSTAIPALPQAAPRDLTDVDSLLDSIEEAFSYAPDPEADAGSRDLSFFDRVKMTCAFASCLYDRVQAGVIREDDLARPDVLADQKLFRIYSFDTSGIQSFLYTIISKHALKALRARSFYLEMLMEHIAAEVLARAGLSRANLLYAGGGHAYLLLPETPATAAMLADLRRELHEWLRVMFRTSIYVADGWCACSAMDMADRPAGQYREIFRTISEMTSRQKRHRYEADEILSLNAVRGDHLRECRVCHRSDLLGADDLCQICGALESISADVRDADYIGISDDATPPAVVLPFGKYLRAYRDKPPQRIRLYRKHRSDPDAVRLWLGDYCADDQTDRMAKNAAGIDRIAVLRADVDDLGQTFVAGFPPEKRTLSRTSALSRHLSRFFKMHINDILKNGKLHLDGSTEIRPRNAAVVYSGGDDLFVIGGWDDVIGFAADLRGALRQYTQGTLHVSAGIGIYPPRYPIAAMAEESGALESHSKHLPGKDAVTLFDEEGRYPWDVLIEKVIGEKLRLLLSFFKDTPERGSSFLYHILALLREIEGGERLNIARFAYLLARIRPKEDGKPDYPDRLAAYQRYADRLYGWSRQDEDRKQLMTAIVLYVYLTRHREEEGYGPVSE